jgi:hypothetical protein
LRRWANPSTKSHPLDGDDRVCDCWDNHKMHSKQWLNLKHFVIISETASRIIRVKGGTLGSMGRTTSSNIFKILGN